MLGILSLAELPSALQAELWSMDFVTAARKVFGIASLNGPIADDRR
jgi:hypothetical protein